MNAWFCYFLKKSISLRPGRFLLLATAVTLGVTVVTALVALSTGIRDKLGNELGQYGANMIVTPGSGGEIDDAVARRVPGLSEHIKSAAYQIYAAIPVKGIVVEIMGTDPEAMTGFRIRGTLPRGGDQVMIGTKAMEFLHVRPNDTIRFDGVAKDYLVTAVFEKGADEDSLMVMPIETARGLTKKSGVSAILLNGDTRHAPDIEDALHATYPDLQVRTLRQIAVAGEKLLGKIQLLMLLVSLVVLGSSVIALGSAMGAIVIERREELGLMKALGAARRDIRRFFFVEAALAGLTGAIAGFCAGIVAAEAVSKTAFGSFVPIYPAAMFASLFLGICISVLATYFPVRDAMRLVPAEILRGE